jgi:predicted nuclease of predicted toxin-antitoxin system
LRFLIDNALSPVLAECLRIASHDAKHIRDWNMQAATDEQIFELAGREERILVSADTDFGTILSLRREAKPSVILFRKPSQRRPEQQSALLLANLPALATSLQQGCVAVIEESRVRVRPLPIGRSEASS